MKLEQLGVADRTITDITATSQWNQLTDTFTPDADTNYVIVELQSLDTATSVSFEVFFDDLSVS